MSESILQRVLIYHYHMNEYDRKLHGDGFSTNQSTSYSNPQLEKSFTHKCDIPTTTLRKYLTSKYLSCKDVRYESTG